MGIYLLIIPSYLQHCNYYKNSTLWSFEIPCSFSSGSPGMTTPLAGLGILYTAVDYETSNCPPPAHSSANTALSLLKHPNKT